MVNVEFPRSRERSWELRFVRVKESGRSVSLKPHEQMQEGFCKFIVTSAAPATDWSTVSPLRQKLRSDDSQKDFML